MEVVRGEEQKEWIVPVGLNPFAGLLYPLVGEVLIAEPRRVAASVKADATDAVVDGGIVAVAPVHLERVPVCQARWVIRAGLFPADP